MSITTRVRRRPLLITGAVLLLLTMATAWVVVTIPGPGQDVRSTDGELVMAQEDATSDEDDGSSALDAAAIPVTYDVFLSRDPFESIMPPEPVATGPADPSDPSVPFDPSVPSVPGIPDDPTDPSRPADKDDGMCRTGTEAVCDGTVLVLVNTSGENATIEVNGTSNSVTPGTTFATNFTLLRIDGSCVDVLFLDGDEAETVRLCVGGVTVK